VSFLAGSDNSGSANVNLEDITPSEIKFKTEFTNPGEISMGFDSD